MTGARRCLDVLLAGVLTVAHGAAAASGQPMFTDATSTALINFVGAYGQTFAHLTGNQPMMQRNMGNGQAVGDYDGDGDLDVYLLAQLGLPNRLFRNNLDLGSKTFTEVTPAVLADLGMSRVAHFADLDNDGDPDLLLINDDDGSVDYPTSKIFRNDGAGVFTDVTTGSGFRPEGYLRAGASLADLDRDGLLDIYVTVWAFHLVNPPAQFPGSNRLYRNLGNLQFEDVTGSVGLGALNRDSFTAILTDFDGNRFADIFVAVDHSSDEFYFNDGDVCTNATAEVGLTHTGNDMGVAAADYDDDGDLDLYVTNITDPGGPFGTTQFNAFHVNLQDTLGTPQFVDMAELHGVEDTYWGWGTEFVDVDNDGDLDLAAVTGFDEFVLDREGPDSDVYQTPSVLFINDGAGNFSRLLGAGLDDPDDSRGLAAFDYDRDGDQDLLITNVNQPARLLENASANSGHWLDIALAPDALAIGARVFADLGAVTQRRDILAGRSYLAGTPPEAHFGLGASTVIDQIRIDWADGTRTTLDDVAADQLLQIGINRIFTDGFESGDTSAWSN